MQRAPLGSVSRRLVSLREQWWRQWTAEAVDSILSGLNDQAFVFIFERGFFGGGFVLRRVCSRKVADSALTYMAGSLGGRDSAGTVYEEAQSLSQAVEFLEALCLYAAWHNLHWKDQVRASITRRRRRDIRRRRLDAYRGTDKGGAAED